MHKSLVAITLGTFIRTQNCEIDMDTLCERYFGSIGNSLHLAAAKAYHELVSVLLNDAGMEPWIPCSQQATLCDDRDHGQEELPFPGD